MKNIKIAELRKYLSNKTEKELIQEIVEHFKLSHSVKRYYNTKINLECEDLLIEEYKSKIEKQFCITELEKYLSNKTEKELIQEIVEYFKLSDSVKRYYSTKINLEYEDLLIEEYKGKIEKQFCGPKFTDFKKINIIISEFRKLSVNHENLADLMLFVVEKGVEFTNEYGYISLGFYSSVENMYIKVMKYINKNNIESKFFERCKQVVKDSLKNAWGFGEYMEELFYTHFKNIENYE